MVIKTHYMTTQVDTITTDASFKALRTSFSELVELSLRWFPVPNHGHTLRISFLENYVNICKYNMSEVSSGTT